jgi:hypothetical protein
MHARLLGLLSLAISATTFGATIPAVVASGFATRDTDSAWTSELEQRSAGHFLVDDRLRLRSVFLEQVTERGTWPDHLDLTFEDATHRVSVPKEYRHARVLSLRLNDFRHASAFTLRAEGDWLTHVRAHAVSEAQVRGDTLDDVVARVTTSGEEGAEAAAILAFAAPATFDALGRRWSSLPIAAQLTALDRLGASRCTDGVPLLTRVLLDGGEASSRAEHILSSCGTKAGQSLVVRFDNLTASHRARIALLLATADATKAFPRLLDAASTSTGPLRRQFRSALSKAALRLSASLIDERLRDSALPPRARLALAAAVPLDAHADAVIPIAEAALRSPEPDERRRGVLLAIDLSPSVRAPLSASLLAAFGTDTSAASRVLYMEALWPLLDDSIRASFLRDRAPSVRTRAAELAKRDGSPTLVSALEAQLGDETWLEATAALADALATRAPNERTQALLARKEEAATVSTFAATFLRARATSGDRRVVGEAKRRLRDDDALLELRMASAEALRILGERSVNGELVRLAKRGADPLSDDDGPLAFACLEALEVLATPSDREALAPLLKTKDPGLRLMVRRILAERAAP